ncbi:MAG: 30S ribosomal protein THX [Hydrogenophilus sp.]|nr:30S ribosomal protein THX [Hydrogenophilus sp.]
MGKGDRRTRRGKLYRGTYGNSRSHRTNRPVPHLAPPKSDGNPNNAR